jgi:hypothetical protein
LAGLGFGLSAFALDVFSLNAPFVAELPWIFFNAASAGLTAYGIAKRRAVPFFLLSVGLHAANSYLASTTELFYITGPLILFFTLLLAWYLYKRTSPTKIP